MSDYPIQLFRFQVDFERVGSSDKPQICQGAFSECTGLEATMEAKVIKMGGSNYGSPQRAGPVTFATVVLKRGITTTRDLWKWFSQITEQGRSAVRLNVTIAVLGPGGEPTFTARLSRAIPVKFKCGDLNARATEIGIEELHLAHEGLAFE